MKLPTELPIKYKFPNLVRNVLLTIVTLLAIYGMWYSMTAARAGYQLYVEADERVSAAEAKADRAMADVVLAMRMLEGRQPVMTADGLKVAEITWSEIKLVKGLK